MLFPTTLKFNAEWKSLRKFSVTPPVPLKYLTLTVNHCHSSKNYIPTLWQPRNMSCFVHRIVMSVSKALLKLRCHINYTVHHSEQLWKFSFIRDLPTFPFKSPAMVQKCLFAKILVSVNTLSNSDCNCLFI